MQCIVMGRPLRALTKGFRGTTASQTPDPGPHGVVDCAAHSDICVQTRGIDALTPVESLYSERFPMHTWTHVVVARMTEHGKHLLWRMCGI